MSKILSSGNSNRSYNSSRSNHSDNNTVQANNSIPFSSSINDKYHFSICTIFTKEGGGSQIVDGMHNDLLTILIKAWSVSQCY